jgi:hypothetical protein
MPRRWFDVLAALIYLAYCVVLAYDLRVNEYEMGLTRPRDWDYFSGFIIFLIPYLIVTIALRRFFYRKR